MAFGREESRQAVVRRARRPATDGKGHVENMVEPGRGPLRQCELYVRAVDSQELPNTGRDALSAQHLLLHENCANRAQAEVNIRKIQLPCAVIRAKLEFESTGSTPCNLSSTQIVQVLDVG